MKLLIQPVLILSAVLISTTGAEEVIYAQVGEIITLTCPQSAYMYWVFQGNNLAWINHLGGRGFGEGAAALGWEKMLSWSQHSPSLVISNIDNKNFGTYRCQKSSKDNERPVATIKVLKVDVSMKPSSPLLPQEFLYLSCSVDTQGDRSPDIYWLSPKKQREKDNTGTVNMMVNSGDSGEWICVVKNGEKVKEAKVTVTVLDFSQAPVHHHFISESMAFTVPCSFTSNVNIWKQLQTRGIQEIYWQFIPKLSNEPQKLYFLTSENIQVWNNTGRSSDLKTVQDLQSGNLSLTKRRGGKDDQGKYMCIAKFKNGATLNRTIIVEMLQIIASPQTDLVSGQPLNLTCSSGHLLPSDHGLRLQWSPPQGSSQSFQESDHPVKLFIPEVGAGDGGKWVCTLWRGKTKLTSAEITLKIEPKLSVWMLVIICSAVASIFLILILVFIFCRRRQRKVRHLRHRLCQCKNPKPKGFYRT